MAVSDNIYFFECPHPDDTSRWRQWRRRSLVAGREASFLFLRQVERAAGLDGVLPLLAGLGLAVPDLLFPRVALDILDREALLVLTQLLLGQALGLELVLSRTGSSELLLLLALLLCLVGFGLGLAVGLGLGVTLAGGRFGLERGRRLLLLGRMKLAATAADDGETENHSENEQSIHRRSPSLSVGWQCLSLVVGTPLRNMSWRKR